MARGRMSQKKVPGAGWVYMVYGRPRQAGDDTRLRAETKQRMAGDQVRQLK